MPQQVLDRPATETAPAKPAFAPLTARDRCDAATVAPKGDSLHQRGPCGAQAFVRVILKSGAELLFCGHCIDEQAQGAGASKNAAVRAIKANSLDASESLADYLDAESDRHVRVRNSQRAVAAARAIVEKP